MADRLDGRVGMDGERSAIGKAYIATGQSLKRFISRLCGDAADVEDIAQEALLRAMDAEADRAIENPKAYLYQVAQNLAVRSRTRKSREIIGYVAEVDDETPSDTPSVEDQVISRERLAMLCDAMSSLPPACRRVFVMRKVYGYSHKEIAERLGISTSTVEKHLATGFGRCVTFMRNRDMTAHSNAGQHEAEARGAAQRRR